MLQHVGRRRIGAALLDGLLDLAHALIQLALHDDVVIDDRHHAIQWLNLGEAARRVAPLSSSAPSASGRSTSESLVFTFTVALDAFVEESFGRIADYAAESLGGRSAGRCRGPARRCGRG